MISFTDNELLNLLKDDLPYLDLTTSLQEKNNIKAKLDIFTREDIVVSCSEDSCQIAKLMNCEVIYYLPSKTLASKGELVLSFIGTYENIHKIWRTTQLILEYSSKISTYTANMKRNIDEVNPNCQLLTTRKTYPFAKKICIKSILNGGANVHRLNLSETILFFPNHRIVYNDNFEFYNEIKNFKIKMPEKKIVIESSSFEDSKNLLKFGVDVLQLDKMNIEDIKKVVELRDQSYKDVRVICSGGININNAKEYACLGIDAIVTSAMYSCGMADFGSKISICE
ncbi:ModD protein [Aliarcobacter lanthieri]|uniref:ModD protein n=1 Tax=Aliarcobacter lanthieri TaxID=1355374 RepID=UPI000479D29E|nr:ModD protein [Aliarcobacter lanthieri]QKF59529.1 quinolinate phosphoribosyltransferase-like protein [Aliarcobacter lanthieri]